MPTLKTDYLRYSPAVEKPEPDEEQTFDELSRIMQHITRTMSSRYRHAYRPVHAKSHGILIGNLDVLRGLPQELAQGLFAKGESYPVVMRFSTNPGDLLADDVSTPRGLAVKVMNVPGPRVANDRSGTSQDFVCINANAFSAPNAKEFVKQITLFDKNLNTSEGVKHVISMAARATNAVLKAVHLPSATLEGIGESATHILGETFTTVTPLRYGGYVAKLAIAPGSDNLKELTGKSVDLGADYNALQLLIQKFFEHQTAVWEVKVQLALDVEPNTKEEDKDFPIEKADKPWPEDKSQWQTVGRITSQPQNSYSDSRQIFGDERLSFSPWNSLDAHRPLGGVMRARLKAYEEAARYRLERNEREKSEPRSIDEIPE